MSKSRGSQPYELLANQRGVLRVIIFASAVIVFSMLLVGTIVDRIVENQVVKKLKEQDLQTIAQAVAGKVDATIERSKETALMLARNPAILKWVEGGEKDGELGNYSLDMLSKVVSDFDYEKSFIVSAVTNQYWSESKKVINTMSKDKPDTEWFFNTLESGKLVSVVIDTDSSRNGDISLFINVLMGDVSKPLGVAGVSLSLQEQAKEFRSYKNNAKSHLWLIDHSGKILLSDQVGEIGSKLGGHVPADIADTVLNHFADGTTHVMDYRGDSKSLHDLISYPFQSGDLRIVYTLDRSETVSFLKTIQINTIIAIIISLVVVVFLFYYVSRRLANPVKHLLQLNQQLENKIAERTKELAEQNVRMSDSIDYALRIQKSLLPSDEMLQRLSPDHLAVWRPKDIVGGDFYWVRETDGGYWAAVGDCTGHGVPGALMTMLAISILDQIADSRHLQDPAHMLMLLNRTMKETLKQENMADGLTDDGLDIGLCYVEHNRVTYAGARCALYVVQDHDVQVVKGDKKSVGYRRTPGDYRFSSVEIAIREEAVFYLASDGIIDQDGGPQRYSFGRQRLFEFIREHDRVPLAEQKQLLLDRLESYMGQAEQRDDFTVLAFRRSLRPNVD